MNLLIIQGHPDKESFNHANAINYYQKAQEAGYQVKMIDLAEENFDPNLEFGLRQHMTDEIKPNHYQELIKEADQLVFLFPTWWGAEPAKLKGFLDRTLTPRFAYHYESATKIEKLLKGKTAKLFITSRGPAFFTKSLFGTVVYRWKHQILGFCGIKVTQTLVLGDMNTKKSTEDKRHAFIQRCADTLK